MLDIWQLARSAVRDKKNDQWQVASYRISKSVSFKDEHKYETLRTVAVRVRDMTDLAMRATAGAQVTNYGIGGHYEPHFDFVSKDDVNAFSELKSGNRIATSLFYVC